MNKGRTKIMKLIQENPKNSKIYTFLCSSFRQFLSFYWKLRLKIPPVELFLDKLRSSNKHFSLIRRLTKEVSLLENWHAVSYENWTKFEFFLFSSFFNKPNLLNPRYQEPPLWYHMLETNNAIIKIVSRTVLAQDWLSLNLGIIMFTW